MAGSSDHQWRLHADMGDELEEGEYVPGQGSHSPSDSDTNTTEYYNRYSSSESDDEASSNACPYFVATSNGAAASCSSSSVVAANNNGYVVKSSVAANSNGYASSSSAAAGPVLACRVCGKEFTSSKAVCGHMKVHALERLVEQGNGKGKEKEVTRVVAVASGWGGTGKSGGCSGPRTRAVSPSSETDNSMAIVVAEPDRVVLEPMPLAYAATNLSSAVRVACDLSGEGSIPQTIDNDATGIVVAGADPPPPTEAIAQHQAAPPLLPLPAAGDQAAPPVRRRQRAAAGTQKPYGYTCGECGAWFRTHQALGGHAAAHKNRRLAAAAAASGTHQDGAGPSHNGSKQEEKRHECKECSAVFAAGVQLGGHMRKHWKGEPIVPKKKMRLIEHLPPPPPADPAVPPLDRADDDVTRLSLVLPFQAGVQVPAPAVERVLPAPAPAEGTAVEAAQPAPEPPATGRVLLFGIDIGPGMQRPRTREGSPATKDSADIGGPQKENLARSSQGVLQFCCIEKLLEIGAISC